MTTTTHLKILSFRRTGISGSSRSSFLKLLQCQNRLESLELAQSDLLRSTELEEILPLMEAMGAHPTLKHMSLRSCYVTTESLVHLFQALERGNKIETLDIGGNAFLQSREWPWMDHLPNLGQLQCLKIPRSMWCHEKWGAFVRKLKMSLSILRLEYDAVPQSDHFRYSGIHASPDNGEHSFSRPVPDSTVSWVTRRNTYLQKVSSSVPDLDNGALLPYILQQLGCARGETSAVFCFLRLLGIWQGVMRTDKKRPSSNPKSPPTKKHEAEKKGGNGCQEHGFVAS